jgi:superfamily II RNA helicase
MNPIKIDPELSRDDLAAEYFDLLPFQPYPVQEEALLGYFTSEQGVLVCAPTGTGKTLIAEAAVYEALRTGRQMYYTTPLIALTDQKLDELQASAVRWGFGASSVGLVTGNRRVNPEAPVLVVVAEILLNRLLNREAFDFGNVGSVVMDEFHSFNDAERGIVWELTLGLLPTHVRTLLLSATVGNSFEFTQWLSRAHNRRLQLVEGTERKVPLQFEWVEDELLGDFAEKISDGPAETRRTPSLFFCFNRSQCWTVAELLRGKSLIDRSRQSELADYLNAADMHEGAGPKLKAILMRGIGVHHAGVLPRYRRMVEELFQKKLLSVCVCTETLSAGINLPARSVVLPSLLKGPKDKKKVVEAATAHQIFGRAGRPQFDDRGFVYALAHEDDVKMHRWRLKYDQIPEDTKDPGLMKAKKQLKKKMPKRRTGEQYWTQPQFEQLRDAASAKLSSRGNLPWRLLAYLLEKNPEVQPIRELVGR